MVNPWLEIPLADYEGHMASPEIDQAGMLADELERLVQLVSPKSVAVVGCAGGNGLERLTRGPVERVVAIDINPRYIEVAADRYAERLSGIELVCADVQSESVRFEPVDLIYAGLVFEYVDVPSTIATMARNCRHGGTLATVLQLASKDLAVISPSHYQSLKLLGPVFKFIEPSHLSRTAIAVGYVPLRSEVIELPSGKRFCKQTFRLEAS